MKSFLFTVVVLLFAIAQVYGIGYYCTKHVVIRKGDTCDDILDYDSKKDYYLKYDQLMMYNPNVDCEDLFEREMICVEVNEKKSPKMLSYKLKPTDTWNLVAKKLNSSKKALYHSNLRIFRYFEDIKDYLDSSLLIDYRRDGKYNPTFDGSVKVDIKTGKPIKKANKNTKKATAKKTVTKTVVAKTKKAN